VWGCGEVRCELRSGADAELAVDLREVPRDRVRAQAELGGHLAVAAAGDDELDDPPLGLRELSVRGGAPADAPQLRARLLQPEARAEPLEDLDCPLETSRLVLDPFAAETAATVLGGDLSALRHAAGWPHDDTLDALRVALAPHDPSRSGSWCWDDRHRRCGTVGGIDPAGDVELGYGLAVEHRGFGYGAEVVTGLSSLADRTARRPSSGRTRGPRLERSVTARPRTCGISTCARGGRPSLVRVGPEQRRALCRGRFSAAVTSMGS
jgi:hypothetical protein